MGRPPLNFKDPGKLSAYDYYSEYSMPLARAFYSISQRGVAVDAARLADLRSFVNGELSIECGQISAILGGKRIIPVLSDNAKPDPLVLNLSSSPQILETLRVLGMTPPKKKRQDGKYTESSDEESLNELFSQTGHPFLKRLLRVRELNKLIGTYIDVELENNILFGTYFVTGTVTGRRSCRENYLGLGSNLQNQPKHTDLADKYRACLIARPGHIFVKCDQVSAEDWIVTGIIADQSGDYTGFNELKQRIDRHAKLASFIFGKPLEQCGKDTPERFMGKKVRHAGNYDMEAFRFSQVMASEGHVVSHNFCDWMLERFHTANPGIRGTYHRYVQEELSAKRCLTSPFGFTRQFFALRDYGDNKKIIKEGYAQIPQGTVGTNTGFAILWLERNHPGYVILDDHDAVTLEVPDRPDSVLHAVSWLQEAFNRIIRLPKGLSFTIPIEVELGKNLASMKTIKGDLNEQNIRSTYAKICPSQDQGRMLVVDGVDQNVRIRSSQLEEQISTGPQSNCLS